MDIQEKLRLYLLMNKEIADFRKKQREQKKILQTLEDEIKEYMKQNEMDSIAIKEGEIILYDRKVSQTYKKETIVEKLTEKLRDETRAEELANSIIANKVFTTEQKLKAKIKSKN